MVARIAKTVPSARKKTKSAAHLTRNDKKVMKHAHLLRGTTRKRKKETKDEPINESSRK
jgi:hypothetical protein